MNETNDIKQRILWLSDIHFLEIYGEKIKNVNGKEEKKALQLLKLHITKFLKLCEEENTKIPFNFILISGDIAQSGAQKEYDLFKTKILNPLLKKLGQNPKLLLIPGNHDVNRDKVSNYDEYFEKNENGQLTDIYSFLQKNKVIYDEIFRNYTDAFKYHPNIPKEGGKKYNELLYHGFYLDHEKKTIFVLLNSSWLSFGEGALKHYLKENLPSKIKLYNDGKPIIKEEDYNILIKDISQRTNEYGNQTIAFNLFENSDLNQWLDYYPEYLVITVCHHPFNWLLMEERIDYKGNNEDFFALRKKSHVMLTGHEHVPYHHLVSENDSNISAGAFIQVKTLSNSTKLTCNLKDAMFSIIDINVNKRTLTNSKYTFEICDAKINQSQWVLKKSQEIFLNKKFNHQLINSRKNAIIKDINNNLKNSLLIKNIFKNIKFDNQDNFSKKYSCFKEKDSSTLYIYITKILIDDANESIIPIIKLKQYILDQNIDTIYFVSIDIHYLNKENSYSEKRDRFEVLNSIKTDIEFEFNQFKCLFFSKINDKEVTSLKEIKFALIIKPYWEIEFLVK